jgi:hypothetical protein
MYLPHNIFLFAAATVAAVGGTLTTPAMRKYLKTTQAKDTWPPFVYEQVAFDRVPSVSK